MAGPYRIHLNVVDVKEPCAERWDRMEGDDFVRFCRVCEKNVYDLSARSRDEAEELLRLHEGPLCIRFRRRADGTVATADCQGARPAYHWRLARRSARAFGIAAGLSAGVLALLSVLASTMAPSFAAHAKAFRSRVGPATPSLEDEPAIIMGMMATPQSTSAAPAWVDPSELHIPDVSDGWLDG